MKILLTLLILCSACETFAHGTGYRNSQFRAVALEFVYSTGEKMSFREAKIFSPKDEKFAFQSGRTDEEGRLAFVPDTVGTWRAIVRDEEGHQCTAEINITQEFLDNHEILSVNQEQEKFIPALLGISLIFNIAMIIRWKNAHK